jgi:hypothetical protein
MGGGGTGEEGSEGTWCYVSHQVDVESAACCLPTTAWATLPPAALHVALHKQSSPPCGPCNLQTTAPPPTPNLLCPPLLCSVREKELAGLSTHLHSPLSQ